MAIVRDTLKTKGVTGLYSGCSALVVGNAMKAGVRFLSYDHFKHKLADSQVCVQSLDGLFLVSLFIGNSSAGKSQCSSESVRCENAFI